MQEAKVPGLAVGIVEAGRPVYVRGFGVMDARDPARPVTAETLFHMASITKPFVATSVMQLAERGRVDLDAPITRYLPYFQLKDPRYRAITVRLMLTHTSGMPDVEDYLWDKPEFDDGALERYVRSLRDKSLRWEPGRKFAYSNMAYEVLGDLVAKVSGMSIEDYVNKNILNPARHDVEHADVQGGGPGPARGRPHAGPGRRRDPRRPLSVQSQPHPQLEPALERRPTWSAGCS